MAPDDTALPSLDATPLEFDAPQHAGSSPAMSCTMCSQPIQAVYYEAGGSVVCARCRGKLESSVGSAGKGGRILRASTFGLLGAVAGSGAYYAIRAVTGYEIGIVAILVGWGVGRAVFLGSGRRGGRGYQVLAVGLTYFAMATTYLPMALNAVPEELGIGGFLLGIGALIAISAALPIVAGMSSPILILILVFGLLQAWRMNERVELSVSGPYRLAPTPAPAAEP
jgi:hypothetical protein